jgi:hypothetical protein
MANKEGGKMMIRDWLEKVKLPKFPKKSILLFIILLVLLSCQGMSPSLAQTTTVPTTLLSMVHPLTPTTIQSTVYSVAPATLQGSMYFVAPTGDDSNPGTESQPWQTIQKAAKTLIGGDTVYIRAGTYTEQVTIQNSGIPGSPIVFAAYPGETPILDGENITLANDLVGLFEISGVSYIRVSGLHVINAGPYDNNAGILVDNSSDITLENISTDNTMSSGIGVWGSQRVVVRNNLIERAGLSGWQECISMAGSSDFIVRNNSVINCQKEGICIKDGSSNGRVSNNRVSYSRAVGIYVDAWDKYTHDIEVSGNIVHHSIEKTGFAVASEQGGQLSNIRLYNNIAYNNYTYGIEISRCCSENHPMDLIFIINNTLYNNGNGVNWGGGIVADNAQAGSVVIRNNIASQNLSFQIAVAVDVPDSNVIVDHNLIDGFRGYEDEVYGEDYVEGDPLFFDPAAANFHLQAGSPGVDAGSEVDAPTMDFDGDIRPQDGNQDGSAIYDIGADEVTVGLNKIYLPIVLKIGESIG